MTGGVVSAAVLLALTWLSAHESLQYVGRESLWRSTISKNPGGWMAHANLGAYLLARGRPHESIEENRKALELRPDLTDVRTNLAMASRRAE